MKSLILIAVAFIGFASQAHAVDSIVHRYRTVRSVSMGGTFVTTGLYDDNFFGNPARATANPSWRISLLDLSAEINKSAIDNINNLSGSGDTLTKVADTTGKNNHVRLQTAMPAVYIPKLGKMSYAIGIFHQTQADFGVRRNYSVDPRFVADIGPALTVARRYMEDDKLSVGATAHFDYRLASKRSYTFADIVKGQSLKPSESAGEGGQVDVDLGGTYILPQRPLDIQLQTGASINNLLGGKYKMFQPKIVDTHGSYPPKQNRQLNVGISASREEVLILGHTVAAFEITDIGNNDNGSLYRLIHMGAETRFIGFLLPRVGINQGYLGGGLGIDLKILQIDLATYGEEMTLNAGGKQDRRYALRIALQI